MSTDVASTIHRVAVLLEAGLTPDRAWTFVDDAQDASRGAARSHNAPAIDEVMANREEPWPEIAVAWRVATIVGAPLAPSLRSLAGAVRDAIQARDDVRVALAEPRATARLVGWLPLLAVVLALALGFDLVQTVTSAPGALSLGAGGALMLAAHLWTRRLISTAQPPNSLPGLQSDVLAIALSGGVSIERAVGVLRDAGGGELGADAMSILQLSQSAGAPAADLLRASANDERHRARTAGRLTAARLSSKLLLPLGVCTLPAFLLVGVAPMLLSIVGDTALPL